MPQFAQGLCLNLPDPLPGDIELFADFLEGPGPAVFEAEAEKKDLPLPLSQGVEDFIQLLLQKSEGSRIGRKSRPDGNPPPRRWGSRGRQAPGKS